MQAPANGTSRNSVTSSASSSSGTMNPGTETSWLLSARAGELDWVEVRVLSGDQPTVTGVDAAKSRELQRTAAKIDVRRFIVFLRIAATRGQRRCYYKFICIARHLVVVSSWGL